MFILNIAVRNIEVGCNMTQKKRPDWTGLLRHQKNIGPGWRPIFAALINHAKFLSERYDEDMKLLKMWEKEKNYCAGWERVKALKERYPTNPFSDFDIDQLKEKFGSMRCYHHGGNEEFYHAVSFAEYLTSYICEECGRAGTQNKTGWIKTLCDECRRKKNEETSKRAADLYTRLKRGEKISSEDLGIPVRQPKGVKNARK